MRAWPALLLAGCLSDGLKAPPVVLVGVQGGTFTMGSLATLCTDKEGDLCGGDHLPHPVHVDEFRIGSREITRLQYATCMADRGCPVADGLDGNNRRIDCPDEPVLVSDTQVASTFCSWMHARLPTEAEFELVQRGGDAEKLTSFPWGDNLTATEDATANGIHDLAAGVPEWVLDGYNPAIGCGDRLSATDVCGSIGCCSGDGCLATCLPGVVGGEATEGGTLACAAPAGSLSNPEINPLYTGSTAVVRGGSVRGCFLIGFVRRHVLRDGSFHAGFRCVVSPATLTAPGVLRFRLNGCPVGATVDISSDTDFQLDIFENGLARSQTSTNRAVTGLACDATYAIHASTVQATATSGNCTVRWSAGGVDLSQGDVPQSGVQILNGTSEGVCVVACQGADLMNDPNNCGVCGRQCASGSSCSGGVCSCGSDVLNDRNNCGACGHSCYGPACIMGECQPGLITDTQPSPYAVAADFNNLYFSNRVTPMGSVNRCAPDLATGLFSCAPLAQNLQNPGLLALDGNSIYWADYDSAALKLCARTGCGGSPTQLHAWPGGGAAAVALEGNSVLVSLNLDGTVQECVLPGCLPGATTLVDTGVIGGAPYGVAADTMKLYYTVNGPSGSLRSCPRSGCTGLPSILIPSLADPRELLLDSGWIYLYESGGESIRRWNTSMSTEEVLITGAMSSIGGLATDATHVFWTDPKDGYILFCQKSDCMGTSRIIARNQSGPLGIAVGGPGIFWANSTGGQVMGMAIPLDTP